MKIVYSSFPLILSAVIFLSSCKSKSSKSEKDNIDYILQDIKPDEFYPAGQVELQFNSTGSAMYGFAYTANGKGPHPTAVLLHGLPGNERSLDIAQNLRRAGFNVVYFNYRGTWGSKGEFKFQNSIADAKAVTDYLTDSINAQKLKVDTSKIVYIGHSMGAGLALIAGLNDPRVKGVFAVSVFNPFTILQGEDAEGNLIGLKEYLLTLGMHNCNPNEFLGDMQRDVKQYDIEKMIANSKKPIVVIDEHMNNASFANYNKQTNFEYKVWNTDHAFTNRRIALSKEIVRWMNKEIVAEPKKEEDKSELQIKK